MNDVFKSMIYDVMESLYYFIVIDTNCRIVYINKSYARFLGAEPKELIGRNVNDVIPNTRLHNVIKNKKSEVGSYMTVTNTFTGKTMSVVCNRLLVFRDGDPQKEIVGAVAETIIQDFEDIEKIKLEIEQLKNQNKLYQSYLSDFYHAPGSLESIIGSSPAVVRLKELISKVANSSASVCITGETGTGKELVANALHKLSNRANKPFVKINCAAIPKDLLEAELFGYTGGAFTGADKNGKIGKFELANKGTILLDEIGEMPQLLQTKLLRVLQEQEIERIGGIKPIPIDVRILCSTNRNLYQMVKERTFRSDLYYRINTIEIEVPPLRNRLDDLEELCPYFIHKANERNGLKVTGIDSNVYKLFKKYDWPGNIRELEHIIERACVIKRRDILYVENFEFLLERINHQSLSYNHEYMTNNIKSLQNKKDTVEREAIIDALIQCNGNKAAAARYLNMDRSSLYYKMKRLNIRKISETKYV